SGPRRRTGRRPVERVDRTAELLARAGYPGIRPAHLWAMCAAAGVVAMVLVAGATRSIVIAIAFGAMAAWSPVAFVRRRRRLRVVELRELWPDVVDNLASAVRAGMSLPEAVTQLATRAPQQLRSAFAG